MTGPVPEKAAAGPEMDGPAPNRKARPAGAVLAGADKGPRMALMRGIGFVDRWLNRPLAGLIVSAVRGTPVTPNQLTWLSAAVGLAAAALFARGEPAAFVFAGLAAQLASVIDGADGMLARVRGECSEFGAHLDLFLDRVLDFAVFAGIALGASRHFEEPRLLALGLLATGLYQLQVILFYLTKSYLRSEERGDTGEARAVLYWVVLLCALARRPDVFVYLLLAETVLLVAFRVGRFVQLGRRRGAGV